MKKYTSIFKISLSQELAYKANFIMLRIRNIFFIVLTYFLWSTVFADPSTTAFGYNRDKILTYVLGIIIVRTLIFSNRSVDIPGEIADGRLSNYIIKPVNFFRYWLIRDASSKLLNFGFSIIEFIILAIILKPPLFIQDDILYLLVFILLLTIANYLMFSLRMLASLVTFWIPELAWGSQFIFMAVITEFLSGSVFPLDIFPVSVQQILNLTPFPYLVFFPLQVYLGKITILESLQGLVMATFWSVVLTFFMKKIWFKGLRVYNSEGR